MGDLFLSALLSYLKAHQDVLDKLVAAFVDALIRKIEASNPPAPNK